LVLPAHKKPFLDYTARQVGLEAPLAEHSDRVNERTKEDLVENVQEMACPGDPVGGSGRLPYKRTRRLPRNADGCSLGPHSSNRAASLRPSRS